MPRRAATVRPRKSRAQRRLRRYPSTSATLQCCCREEFNGKPYWLALGQCGGTYFKLNIFYADAAAHARVIKPDPKATADYTKELKEAIKTATVYFDATERFLMNDRGIERVDAVLTYDPQSRAAGDRLKTVDAALAAAQACPALYHACQGAYPKVCSESLSPTS